MSNGPRYARAFVWDKRQLGLVEQALNVTGQRSCLAGWVFDLTAQETDNRKPSPRWFRLSSLCPEKEPSLMKTTLALALSLAVLCVQCGSTIRAASPAAGKQVEQSFQAKDGGEVPYLLYLPDDFDEQSNTPRPVMLFLHGRGESSGPLSLVAKWGPPQMVERGEKFPFILISPQCPKEDAWSSQTQQSRISQLLDSVVDKFKADKDHIYLAGLSMGGSGSWRMAADHPDRFAAVVPICGRGEIADAGKLKNLPIWVFVGDQDRVFQANVDMVEAIRKAGSQSVRLTTLENIGHNSWSAAFASPDLYAWLEKQTRAKRE